MATSIETENDVARVIAGGWHGGPDSELYHYASTGNVRDRAALRAEISACEDRAETAQLEGLALLRVVADRRADAQQRQVIAELCRVPERAPASIDLAEPGALEADKARITAAIERAVKELEFGPYVGFTMSYGRTLDKLAEAYISPEVARAALLRHADAEMERLSSAH